MIEIFKNKEVKIFFSFIIGLGISILAFHRPFSSINHLNIPVSQIEGKVVKYEDKCYSYISEDVKCFNEKSNE